MTPDQPGSFSYSIFSFVVEDALERTVPVGVALWSPQRRWVRVKFIGEREKLKGLDLSEHYPFIRLVRDKVSHWIETGKLPHSDEHFPPFDDRWWRHARKLLIHRVRLSEPRPIDCHDPEEELEALFESIVAAHRPSKASRSRIDGRISECLDGLSEVFKTRQSLPGFGGRTVTVLRAYKGRAGWVVIEGVNLASHQAEMHSDATASKLMRVREALQEKCKILIGYIASHHGLNGEKPLVDWLAQKTGARTFDLFKQKTEFNVTAREFVSKIDGQGSLFSQSQSTD